MSKTPEDKEKERVRARYLVESLSAAISAGNITKAAGLIKQLEGIPSELLPPGISLSSMTADFESAKSNSSSGPGPESAAAIKAREEEERKAAEERIRASISQINELLNNDLMKESRATIKELLSRDNWSADGKDKFVQAYKHASETATTAIKALELAASDKNLEAASKSGGSADTTKALITTGTELLTVNSEQRTALQKPEARAALTATGLDVKAEDERLKAQRERLQKILGKETLSQIRDISNQHNKDLTPLRSDKAGTSEKLRNPDIEKIKKRAAEVSDILFKGENLVAAPIAPRRINPKLKQTPIERKYH